MVGEQFGPEVGLQIDQPHFPALRKSRGAIEATQPLADHRSKQDGPQQSCRKHNEAYLAQPTCEGGDGGDRHGDGDRSRELTRRESTEKEHTGQQDQGATSLRLTQ